MSDPDDVLEALASLPSFHHPTATEDGDRVARYYDDTGRNELHSETGERHQASDGEVPRNARWGSSGAPTATGCSSASTRTATSRTTSTLSTWMAPRRAKPNPSSKWMARYPSPTWATTATRSSWGRPATVR